MALLMHVHGASTCTPLLVFSPVDSVIGRERSQYERRFIAPAAPARAPCSRRQYSAPPASKKVNVTRHLLRTTLLLAVVCWVVMAPRAWGLETDERRVRLALVNIPDDIVRPLLPAFEASSGMKADIVYTGSDPFEVARAGKADLVISHYGHPGVKPFVSDRLGAWPQTVFANQLALLGPASDPARVRGMTDAAAALAKIAAAGATFVANDSAGTRYVEKILWISAAVTPAGAWYVDSGEHGRGAAEEASRRGAYVLWGLPPFLRNRGSMKLELEPLVVEDPLFARVMVSVVVEPQQLPAALAAIANPEGAKAFQSFLLSPEIQARIRGFRYPGVAHQVWWPAGRHNSGRE